MNFLIAIDFIDIGIYTFREAMGPIFVWFHLWFSFQFRWSIITYKHTPNTLTRSTFWTNKEQVKCIYALSLPIVRIIILSWIFTLSLFLFPSLRPHTHTSRHSNTRTKTFNDHNNPGFVRFSVFLYKWALKKKWSLVFLAFKVWNQFYERS